MPLNPAAVLALIGAVQEDHLRQAAAILESIPDELRGAAHRPHGAQAVIFGLLLESDPEVRKVQTQGLHEHAPPEVREQLERVLPALVQLPAAARVPLVELTFPALRMLSRDEYRRFRDTVEALVKADRRLALFEYTLRRMLLRHLDPHFSGRKPVVARYYALRPLLEDCGALLSALAHVGQEDPQAARTAFQSGAALLGPEGRTLRFLAAEECSLRVVDQALARLAEASAPIKKRVLSAALGCVAADERVTMSESELLRAVADALDCPMPPLAAPGTT